METGRSETCAWLAGGIRWLAVTLVAAGTTAGLDVRAAASVDPTYVATADMDIPADGFHFNWNVGILVKTKNTLVGIEWTANTHVNGVSWDQLLEVDTNPKGEDLQWTGIGIVTDSAGKWYHPANGTAVCQWTRPALSARPLNPISHTADAYAQLRIGGASAAQHVSPTITYIVDAMP